MQQPTRWLRHRSLLPAGLLAGSILLAGAALADPPPAEPPPIPPELAALVEAAGGFLKAADDAPAPAPEPAPEATDEAAAPPAEQTADAPAGNPPTGDIEVNPAGLLHVHVRDMPIPTLLEMLSYEARANIVASTNVSGSVSANLYDVTLEEVLHAVLVPNHYAWRPIDGMIYVGTPEEIATLAPPPETRIFKLRYITPADAAAALESVLGETARIVQSGGSDEDEGGGSSRGGISGEARAAGINYLVITATPEQLRLAADVLAQLDERPRQVLIESTILRATLNESNQFGIDFTMLGGVDFQDVGSTSNAARDLTTGQLLPRDFDQTTFNISTDFAGNVADGGFTFGLINNGIATFVRALEDITDVVVVANPKIVALNKQEAQVIVGRRDGYLTTTVTETAAVQTVEFLETGTQIRFRPVINLDGTVRLTVHPKDSNGGLTAANLPFEETTEAHADILVNDGHTILIGGLFRERTVNSKNQIPVLGDIPIIGLGFSSRNDQTVREEVIILLTVHVIKETPHEQAVFRQLLEDVERVRVGSRRGLVETGRERLAQAYLHEALRQLERGHKDLALLNLRMVLNNQPTHMSAIKLFEQLRQDRLWDDEGTRARTLIWSLIAPGATVDRSEPDFGRPPVILPSAGNEDPEEAADE
jgi:type IV pilus assembly protein PilQ